MVFVIRSDNWYWNGVGWSSGQDLAVRFDNADDAYRAAQAITAGWVIDAIEAKPEYWNPDSEDFDNYCQASALVRAEEDEMSEDVGNDL
jgi:hypothetical protein